MIDRPERGALAELTSLSLAFRPHLSPLAGAGGLAALSVSCNPVKEPFLNRKRGVPRKRAQRYELYANRQNIQRTFFIQNDVFNILSLNRRLRKRIHIIYNNT